jgi:hypothetical protein
MQKAVNRRQPTSLSWRLSRGVIKAVDLAGAEFAQNADSGHRQLVAVERHGQAQVIRFCTSVAARVKPGS